MYLQCKTGNIAFFFCKITIKHYSLTIKLFKIFQSPRVFDDSKLTIDVNVCVNSCLSLCKRPADLSMV